MMVERIVLAPMASTVVDVLVARGDAGGAGRRWRSSSR